MKLLINKFVVMLLVVSHLVRHSSTSTPYSLSLTARPAMSANVPRVLLSEPIVRL